MNSVPIGTNEQFNNVESNKQLLSVVSLGSGSRLHPTAPFDYSDSLPS